MTTAMTIKGMFTGWNFEGDSYRVTHVRVTKGSKTWELSNAKSVENYIRDGFVPTTVRYTRNSRVVVGSFNSLPV
jgi:hypothetical protein